MTIAGGFVLALIGLRTDASDRGGLAEGCGGSRRGRLPRDRAAVSRDVLPGVPRRGEAEGRHGLERLPERRMRWRRTSLAGSLCWSSSRRLDATGQGQAASDGPGRHAVIAWIGIRKLEATRNAGDPGPVPAGG